MTKKAYSIRDSKSEVYNTPFFQQSNAEAIRSFLTLLNDQSSMVAKYPDDFDLYLVGEYNDQDGTISGLDTPQHLEKAIHLIKQTSV